uniref:Lysosomal trafficking regulator n=1 Tax=Rhinolophus ferrumequinum TaxID=59479 RepID=A0A671G4Z9_RHIFE
MSIDSNSLAREFLTDVNRLCNAVVQRVEAREEEEEETHMAALGQYLVHGRGFLLLTKLNSIIDQALTCREELLTLLLSLLPLVWRIPVQEERATDFNLPFSADIILTKEKNSSSQRSTQEKLYLEGSAPSGQVSAKVNVFRKSRRQRKSTHRYSIRDARKTQLSTSDSEANSDDKSIAVSKHRRPHQLQHLVTQSPKEELTLKPDRLSTKEQTPDTMALETFQEIMPTQEANTDILSEPAALSIISHMHNSPFDLCHVLLSLLEKVCKFDITLNHNSALAASVVPTLTEFLAGFGDCCHLSDSLESPLVSAGWTEEPVALIQRMLFRTVLHLMSVDISTAEMIPESLRKNLTELLRAALKIRTCLEKQPDPFAPRQKKTLQEFQEGFVFSKYRHRALLLPELLEGVLQILICCLQSAASNPFFFSQAMDLVQEFIQHNGFNLFETAVLQMEWLIVRDGVPTEASEHLKALINSVMKIMSAVKKVKSEQLHHSMCTRKRHRRCEYSHFMHHHRDLSGLLVSAFKNQVSKNPFEETADGEVYYPERCCCLAVCAHQCLRLLQQASLSSTCVQILSGVHNVGICCCMDPKSVIIPLLHAFQLPALKNFQQHILNILNKLILDQLGGAEISHKIKKAACNVCTVDSDQLAKLEETLQGASCEAEPPSGLPSPSCRFQGILPSSGSEDLLWRWDALEAYQNFVFEGDRLHSVQIANHICSLIQKGNVVVQWKLYNYIFNPVLQRGVELAHHCQHLSITTAQSHVCGPHSQCLPQEVLQIYLKMLSTLLKSRIIRDLFLSCNGVSQLIELNYLDGVRSHSLKAFETLIISLGEQQKDSSIPGPDGLDLEQKESSPLRAGTSLHNQQAYSDSPPSLSKFYASLKEAYPKKRKLVNQDVHINTINVFLCVAFLCVSKEAEADGEPANDSEDTSGYDSTASEPLHHVLPCLSLESLVLPSPEQMHQAADIWSVCHWIYMLSPVFQKQFYRLGGFRVCYKLIFMIIQQLLRSHEQEQGKKEGDINVSESQDLIRTPQSELSMKEDVLSLTVKCPLTPSDLGNLKESADSLGKLESQHISSINVEHISATEAAPEAAKGLPSRESETSLQSIRLLEALLAICLHGSRASQQKMELELPDQNLSVENILLEMRDHLSQSKVIETELAKPLFDALLRVAVGNHSADFEHGDALIEKSHQSEEELSPQPGHFSEEAEDSHCCSFKLLVEEEGYEADSESNPEDSETWDDGVEVKPEAEDFIVSSSPSDPILENLTHGEIIYPEICMLELNLLSTCKAKLDVITHVFESFLKIIRQKEKNIFLLMQQGTVKNLLGGFLSILTQADSDFQACQRVLVDLLVSLMSTRTCSEELTLLLRIFLEKSPCTRTTGQKVQST